MQLETTAMHLPSAGSALPHAYMPHNRFEHPHATSPADQAERKGAHKTTRAVACDAGMKPAGKQRLLGTLKFPKHESKLSGLERAEMGRD